MCWTLCYKTNICTKHLLISDDDAFKIWCIFNFLSEDKYPLVIITEEVRKSLSSCCPFLLGNEVNIITNRRNILKHQGNMLVSSFLSVSLDRVPPAKVDGGHGEQMEWGELHKLQAAAACKEELPDCLGAYWAAGDWLLHQGHEPSDRVHGHQWSLPGTHTGRAEAG